MKAPDKIYVEACEDGIFAFPEPPFAESVEYIRADIVKQPVEGLDAEIEKYFQGWSNDDEYGDALMPDYMGVDVDKCKDIARHFAEWGAEHLRDSTKMVER